MNSKNISNARVAAALSIRDVMHESSLTPALDYYTANLSPQDKGLSKAIAYGVCRHYFSICQLVNKHLQKPLRKKDHDVYALLLVGAFQRFHLDLPPYAAIDSVVEACKLLNKNWAVKLVNAVMRKVNQQEKPKAQFEHPDWLIEQIKQAYPEHFRQIIQANNQQPPLCLRINSQQTSRDAYLEKLEQAGIQAEQGLLSEDAIYLLDKPSDITTLPGFKDGLVSVQDESPQLCASLLELKPGLRVLDACAAPGGKTCHMLEREPQLAQMWAIDIDANRLDRVEENLQRLDLRANLIAADINALDDWYDGQTFDRILCDAPCSATGVIRRHPDIKLLRKEDDIFQLAKLQMQVLESLWQCLSPGGILLYATCSILPKENKYTVKSFLETHTDAQLMPISLPKGIESDYGWQMLPEDHAQDGFFFAKIHKAE
ncbi:MAG: 16S rRNA (cytosine(967)-C(5))-methyltransferase RsmB [Sinobacterium sp.]|nr:16S rRNA (cytosine(967)-C(5))-methyltransferase RsmB [Sinobacterium sp.]